MAVFCSATLAASIHLSAFSGKKRVIIESIANTIVKAKVRLHLLLLTATWGD